MINLAKSGKLIQKENEKDDQLFLQTGTDNVYDKQSGKSLDMILGELKRLTRLNQEFAGKFRVISDWNQLGLSKKNASFETIVKALPTYSIFTGYKNFSNDRFFPEARGHLTIFKANDNNTSLFIYTGVNGSFYYTEYMDNQKDVFWHDISGKNVSDEHGFGGDSLEKQPDFSITTDSWSWYRQGGIATLNINFKYADAQRKGSTLAVFTGMPPKFMPKLDSVSVATAGQQRFILTGEGGRIFLNADVAQGNAESISISYAVRI